MDPRLLLLVAWLASLCLLVALFFWIRRRNQLAESHDKDEDDVVAEAQRPRPVGLLDSSATYDRSQARARRGMDGVRRRLRNQADADQDHLSDEEVYLDEPDVPDGNLTKAERRKLAKAERKAQRAAVRQGELDSQTAKQRKEAARAEARRKKEEEREERERQEEEERKRAEEERKKKEEEEYQQWKDAFSVESAGAAEQLSAEETQDRLHQFLNYIKTQKVVVLDDVAAEFGMRTQEVVDRIKTLEADGFLTGVMDDRGKFIFISDAELDSVADWIKRWGRVSISDIVGESNKLIDLTPSKPIARADPSDPVSV